MLLLQKEWQQKRLWNLTSLAQTGNKQQQQQTQTEDAAKGGKSKGKFYTDLKISNIYKTLYKEKSLTGRIKQTAINYAAQSYKNLQIKALQKGRKQEYYETETSKQ